MASLDSVKQKVIRAKEHLKSLQGENIRYFEGKPGDVVTEVEDTTGRLILRFVAVTPVPAVVPIIIGDAIQNLRSALDYLVWELVLAANNQPTDKNTFPICTSPDAFKDQLSRGRLTGIAPNALAEIEALQPYHYGQNCEFATIRVLDAFCNINKHRRVLLTVLAAHMSRTEFTSSESGSSVQEILSPRYDDAEIAIGPTPSKVGETVEVKGDLIFFITFNEGTVAGMEIAKCLNALYRFVNEGIVPRFENFFL
jgi:hypothetical protein